MSGRRSKKAAIRGPFETTIEALATDARGIGRLGDDQPGLPEAEGLAVFIKDALPGEHVRYMRTRLKPDFAEGRLEAVLEPSPHRVEPKCEYFGNCGGCALQHFAHDQQIVTKQEHLLETLARIGKVTPARVLEPLVDAQWGYRRRARLAVRAVKGKGRTLVGFRERDGRFVADMQHCDVLIPEVGYKLDVLSEMLDGLSIRDAIPQVEVAGSDADIALIFRIMTPIDHADTETLLAFGREHGFVIYTQTKGLDTVAPLAEPANLHYSLPTPGHGDGTVRFDYTPVDFVQVNAGINRKLVPLAVSLLDPQAHPKVVELFAGLGNFTMPLAAAGATVTAVEGEAGLVERAHANAAQNGLADKITASVANLFDPADNWDWASQQFDAALLDPPRAGAQECLPALVKTGVRRIVYVSCHPATLARDVGILVNEYGYTLDAAGAIDMFPHTAHLESIAVLTR